MHTSDKRSNLLLNFVNKGKKFYETEPSISVVILGMNFKTFSAVINSTL